jgi:hypothetical protein
MNRRTLLWAALALPLGGLLSGCSEKVKIGAAFNLSPTVRITNAPRDTTRGGSVYYAVTLNWIGNDPDGRVDHFLYAQDPPRTVNTDTAWVRTTRSEQIILWPSTQSNPATVEGEDPHVFAIKAVDDRGAESPVEFRAFWSRTDAPTVRISSPVPKEGIRAYVTPAVRIQWSGEDPDGVFTKKPVQYKYKLLSDQTEVTETTARTAAIGPDTIRRYYAPRNWVGWDSTTADTTEVQFTNLVPDEEYVFCVIAFDEAGAYSPVFRFDTNCLYFRVTFAGPRNPVITLFNQFFFFQYPQGSYEPLNPQQWIPLEIPANQPVTFYWFAQATDGSAMQGYRWAVDILDLTDETQRTGPLDLAHWSSWDLGTTSATLPGYAGSDTVHTFYLEARDINGLVSLGIIKFTVVQPSFAKDLLVVKDYRLQVDQRSIGQTLCMNPPVGVWPTVAELDTFLFAQGGHPWRCYPGGAISSRGIFAGYPFDTLGTRTGRADQTVKLSTLGQYRKVVWMVDRNGAGFRTDGTTPTPMSSLRYMSSPNRANTLATYITQGGKVWLLGGGGAAATNIPYDRPNNNTTPPAPSETYSFANNELVPGRFMYDLSKWQSEFKATRAGPNFLRYFGRYDTTMRRGGRPPYWPPVLAPPQLRPRTQSAGTDPFPPNRPLVPTDFYYNQVNFEYLSKPNPYQEDFDPGPGESFQSALDTLYYVRGTGTVGPIDNPFNVVMTVYPARDRSPSAQVVFSGVDVWSWRRTDSKALVDFVLQELWGVFPTSPPASRARPAVAQTAVPSGQIPAPGTAPSISSTRSRRTAPTPGR